MDTGQWSLVTLARVANYQKYRYDFVSTGINAICAAFKKNLSVQFLAW